VKIGDFGIAVQMCLNNDKQSFIMPGVLGGGGTLYWMAPEVIKNEKLGKTDEKYGRAADMWYASNHLDIRGVPKAYEHV
jgi:serine/threonine protein kinase